MAVAAVAARSLSMQICCCDRVAAHIRFLQLIWSAPQRQATTSQRGHCEGMLPADCLPGHLSSSLFAVRMQQSLLKLVCCLIMGTKACTAKACRYDASDMCSQALLEDEKQERMGLCWYSLLHVIDAGFSMSPGRDWTVDSRVASCRSSAVLKHVFVRYRCCRSYNAAIYFDIHQRTAAIKGRACMQHKVQRHGCKTCTDSSKTDLWSVSP